MRKSIGKTLEELFQNAKISHSDAPVTHNQAIAFRHSFLTHSACPVKPQLQNHHFVKDLRYKRHFQTCGFAGARWAIYMFR